MVDAAGKTANRNGKWLEDTIADQLRRAGYKELGQQEKVILKAQDGFIDLPDDESWFVSQVALERNLYGAMFTSDFYLKGPKYPSGLHIESKFQGTPGSVDEKYVFTVLSMKQFKSPGILVLDGGGTRQGAVRWMKSQQKKDKFDFMTLGEFMIWARDHL
jgi:hypothetical protein